MYGLAFTHLCRVPKYLFTFGLSTSAAFVLAFFNDQVLAIGRDPEQRGPVLSVVHCTSIFTAVTLTGLATVPIYNVNHHHPLQPWMTSYPSVLHKMFARYTAGVCMACTRPEMSRCCACALWSGLCLVFGLQDGVCGCVGVWVG